MMNSLDTEVARAAVAALRIECPRLIAKSVAFSQELVSELHGAAIRATAARQALFPSSRDVPKLAASG